MTYNGQWAVAYSANGSTWTDISSYVVNGTMRVGRQQLTDRYTPDTFSVELLAPLTAGQRKIEKMNLAQGHLTQGLVDFVFGGIVPQKLAVVLQTGGILTKPEPPDLPQLPLHRLTLFRAQLGQFLQNLRHAHVLNLSPG